MGKFVSPRVYHVGTTGILSEGLMSYLLDTGNGAFVGAIQDAREQGLSDAEILCSFYAKLCYKSLTEGQNANLSGVRGIKGNLFSTMEQAHGSVFEHAQLNFVATDVSRVFTHEAVRHRVGVAFSQTSGRFVRGTEVNVVFDPVLEPIRELCEGALDWYERWYARAVEGMGLDQETDFARKKKVTSALRRFLPNGQANELGFSHNIRSLRHVVQMRTAEAAEREIREVYAQVYQLTRERYPLLYYGAKERVVDGVLEISGMKLQPYERGAT